MGKIIRFIVVFVTVLAIGAFVLHKLVSPSWVFDLPNGYKIRKTSNSNVVLGVEIDGDFYTQYQDRQVGVEEYVAEFQYNEDFIGLKCLHVDGEDASVLFYLVNTKEQEVRGPYEDEESYLAVVGVWSSDVLSSWISTTEAPEGARFQ